MLTKHRSASLGGARLKSSFDIVHADKRLQEALSGFQDRLTPEQKLAISKHRAYPTVQDVAKFTIELDEEIAKRNRLRIASRVRGLLECVQPFCTIVDTFVASSEIGSLIWGSIKVTFLVRNIRITRLSLADVNMRLLLISQAISRSYRSL